MEDRKLQMKWLLGLTAFSLVPVYILIGWQSSGHGPDTIDWWFWLSEAGAWGLRALVEAWALIYLFQTVTSDKKSSTILTIFESCLISLVALTVGLVIIANGNAESIAKLPSWLFWLWSFSVAAFAPLMMGSVGFAYKVHEHTKPITKVVRQDTNLTLLTNMIRNQPKMTNKQLASEFNVSVSTISNWKKQLNGSLKEAVK